MKTKILHKLAYIFSILIFGTILGISLQLVHAWTEPAVAPPGGNVGAPINTGATGQTKIGGYLQAWNGVSGGVLNGEVAGLLDYAGYGGFFTGTGGVFSENSSGYYTYLDYPGSNYGVYTNGVVYAPIMYDFNNVGYYVDPASTSVMNAICAGGSCGSYLTNDGTYLRAQGNFRTTGTFYNDGYAYTKDIYLTDISKWASSLGGGKQVGAYSLTNDNTGGPLYTATAVKNLRTGETSGTTGGWLDFTLSDGAKVSITGMGTTIFSCPAGQLILNTYIDKGFLGSVPTIPVGSGVSFNSITLGVCTNNGCHFPPTFNILCN